PWRRGAWVLGWRAAGPPGAGRGVPPARAARGRAARRPGAAPPGADRVAAGPLAPLAPCGPAAPARALRLPARAPRSIGARGRAHGPRPLARLHAHARPPALLGPTRPARVGGPARRDRPPRHRRGGPARRPSRAGAPGPRADAAASPARARAGARAGWTSRG